MANPDLLGLDAPQVWDTQLAFTHLNQRNQADSKRTAERRLQELEILPLELNPETLSDELGRRPTSSVLSWDLARARTKRKLVLFAQLTHTVGEQDTLHANDARGARYWLPLDANDINAQQLHSALQRLQAHTGKDIVIFPSGRLVEICRQTEAPAHVELGLLSYPAVLDDGNRGRTVTAHKKLTPHLKQLEAESLQIIREAVAESDNPAMLYAIGKDSAVMLHLVRKAFYPAPPPLPLLHIDTRWKFQEMYRFRDLMARESGMDLLVHINPQAISKDINPFDHGPALHTEISETEGLKQALNRYQFDLLLSGARRDEAPVRAKERIFSLRAKNQHWDPQQQRAEPWNLYNTRKKPGESLRVFPLSNWTELDIWQYIYQVNIPLVPLYFAKERPVINRNGRLLLIDDERMRLLPDDKIEARRIRFRSLGCYPLVEAVESQAASAADILLELLASQTSERQGHGTDSASTEKQKQEGYF
jgi:sulfate adenylyltransferase subunit 2